MSDDENYAEARVTVWLSERLKTDLKSNELGYEDSMSEWVRRACQDRLLLEGEFAAEDIAIPEDPTERGRLFRDVLRAGIDATADERED